MKDIRVNAGQPVLTPHPMHGQKVTADQFALDFEVEIDSAGCYVVEVKLYAEALVRIPRPDPPPAAVQKVVVLDDASATAEPLCLAKGKTLFRAGPTEPAPAGATPVPAAAAGTKTIAVNGSWPDWQAGTKPKFTYLVTVYRIGPCEDGKCKAIQRSDLAKKQTYLQLEGPRAPAEGGGSTVAPLERDLALVTPGPETRPYEVLASVEERMGVRLSRSESVSIETHTTTYTLALACEAQTFWQPGILVECRPRDHRGNPPVSFVMKPTWSSLTAAARGLARLEAAVLDQEQNPSAVAFYSTPLVLHGLLSFTDAERSRLVPFVNGRPVFALFDRGDPQALLVPTVLAGLWDLLFGDDDDDDWGEISEDQTVWVKSKIGGQGFWHGAGEVLAHAWAYGLGWSIAGPDTIVDGRADLVRWLGVFPAHRGCIKRLRILSHGGKLWAPSGSGTVTGSTILIGETTELRSDDFDEDGNLVANNANAAETKKVLDALKAALCPGARLIFSACNQKVGGLLEHISKYIDKGISVEGYADIGVPYGDLTLTPLPAADMVFKDGVRQ